MNEFRKQLLKVDQPRKHKISHSLGVYDVYKAIRKLKWLDIGRPLTEQEFYTIIREVNTLLAQELAKGIPIKLPHRLGILEVRKKTKKIRIVKNKVKINTSIDWNSTLNLWEEDQYSFNKRQLVRYNNEETFCIYWNKSGQNALFNNKSIILFKPNRKLLKSLQDNVKEDIIKDAYLLSKYYID